MTEILLVNRKFSDLNPLITGTEECSPSHSWAGVRNYTLIHYVVSDMPRMTELPPNTE